MTPPIAITVLFPYKCRLVSFTSLFSSAVIFHTELKRALKFNPNVQYRIFGLFHLTSDEPDCSWKQFRREAITRGALSMLV